MLPGSITVLRDCHNCSRSWLTPFRSRKRSGSQARGCHGSGQQARKRRDIARAKEHHKLMAEQESSYEAAILTDSGPGIVAELLSPGHSTPPRPIVAAAPTSSSPPAASPPKASPLPTAAASAGRSVRHLDLAMDNAQASESTQPVDEADAAFPSCAAPSAGCKSTRIRSDFPHTRRLLIPRKRISTSRNRNWRPKVPCYMHTKSSAGPLRNKWPGARAATCGRGAVRQAVGLRPGLRRKRRSPPARRTQARGLLD